MFLLAALQSIFAMGHLWQKIKLFLKYHSYPRPRIRKEHISMAAGHSKWGPWVVARMLNCYLVFGYTPPEYCNGARHHQAWSIMGHYGVCQPRAPRVALFKVMFCDLTRAPKNSLVMQI